MKKVLLFLVFVIIVSVSYIFLFLNKTIDPPGLVVDMNIDYFIKDSILGKISKEMHTLSDGTETLCYVIKTKSIPHEHQMGPWCPTSISSSKKEGGIWFDKGKVYDVDGNFIKNLADFYSDHKWKLFRNDGSILTTTTKEAFEKAARPNVDPRYHNHCVEGKPEWVDHLETTYIIPVHPVFKSQPTKPRHDGLGIAFNGVNFDPPAPVHAILHAHTLAPLDDSGGHINPHSGYHYHAATGYTKEIEQKDNHAPMIGYALDGFAIFANLDKNGKEPLKLDECGGHFDNIRGYHYHAGKPGDNQIIKAFRGAPGFMIVASEK